MVKLRGKVRRVVFEERIHYSIVEVDDYSHIFSDGTHLKQSLVVPAGALEVGQEVEVTVTALPFDVGAGASADLKSQGETECLIQMSRSAR